MHSSPADGRFRRITAAAGAIPGDFAADVRAGLTASPKRLECRYFYDAEGSRLFEAICALPEYYLTRTERSILERHAGSIAAACARGAELVELGSGSAVKTRLLIEAFLERDGRARYVPLDISRNALEESAASLLADYPTLRVTAIEAEYFAGLDLLAEEAPGPKLVLWLGSNVGNFDRPAAVAFLRHVRERLAGADRLLIGIDLRKSRAVLEPAYDDAAGVTARFNKNLFARINRELQGDLDLAAFRHVAFYNEGEGRVELHLESQRAQRAHLGALGLNVDFAAGERVHTENSYKYSDSEIEALLDGSGLRLVHQWRDERSWFSVNLLRTTG
jgi:L-histidine Nalpha-methyltransferase